MEITPEQAATWAVDKKTIYDEEGKVADSGAAEILAYKEKDMREMEEALAKQAEGANDEQRDNLAFIKEISGRHPGTLVEQNDGGEVYWVLTNVDPRAKKDVKIFFSKNGIYRIFSTTTDLDKVSLKKAEEKWSSSTTKRNNEATMDLGLVTINPIEPTGRLEMLSVKKLDEADPHDFETLKNHFEYADWAIKDRAEKGEEATSIRAKARASL